MDIPEVVTSFQFQCGHCSAANEYVHEHGPNVRPFLVSTRCTKCFKLNKFEGLPGTLVTTQPGRGKTTEAQIELVPIDTHVQS